ncbi:imm11 family protein [Niveibacterium sp.]|uniref:imm11 family protein n=1 Tax=Niveibacterium sp. TaxID=2017444 RepID=UPI0035AF2BBE
MDYFLWQNRRMPGDAMIYGGWPSALGISMISGDRVAAPAAPIDVTLNAESQGRLTDSLLMTGAGRVFSERLVALLLDMGVGNIDAYPCRVVNVVTGEVREDFRAVNVIGKIACVDRAKSEFEDFGDGSNRILIWDYLTLDEARIGGNKLFPLAEMPVQLVVHRDIKLAIESAGFSGMEFVPQGDQSFKPAAIGC